jgi:small-conductance mechanosensitive channel
MTLSTLGISITPLIASLGITSLAVALALQPTLENFFSGVQILIDKPIRLGDFIELESGEQGFVEKIGWRSTWIKMLPNNIVIMPNSLISKSKLINYYYPEKELSVPVEVGVHYDSDLEHVERVTLEVAREILASHKWGISDYETFVVYHTFDNSSINFTVMLRAQEYFNRFFIKSAFIKALHQRYREEGITIPYPIRAINYDQEKADKEI